MWGRRSVLRALRAVERDALWADRVDWPSARARVLAALDDPDALAACLRELAHAAGGPQAGLYPGDGPRVDGAALPTVRLVDDVGVLTLPACDRRDADRYVDAGERAYSRAVPAERWVVDLRAGGGGSMWPLLAVAAPLLRAEGSGATIGYAGTVGYSVAPGRPGTPWRVTATAVCAGRRPAARRAQPRTLPGPVAVLTGAGTTSAGEAVAVAFRGLADVRSFGAPTRGRSTADRAIPLPDGATLVVPTARFADRTGRTYGAAVEPDVPAEGDVLALALADVARR